MNASREDLLQRLDTAMAGWERQVSDAYSALCERVGRAHEQVMLLRQEAQSHEADRVALQQAHAQITALQEDMARRDAERATLQQKIARLTEENALLLDQVRTTEAKRVHVEQVSDTVTGELSGRVAQLERELAVALEDVSRQGSDQNGTQEVRSALTAERLRADLLQEQLRETREAGARADSEQLAAALRDRDEAHQQIVALRTEIDLLRRMNASLSAPASPAPAAEAETQPVAITDPQGRKRRMGDVLVELGVVSREQLDTALQAQTDTPQRRLGSILVEMGFASEEAVARILARQLGLTFVRLTPEVVDPAATRIIGAPLARRRNCLPIGATPDRIVLAMANPLDLITIDDVELAGGRNVEPVVATTDDILSALERYYGSPI